MSSPEEIERESSRIEESINAVLAPDASNINPPLTVKEDLNNGTKVEKHTRTRNMKFSKLRGLRLIEYYQSEPFLATHKQSRIPADNVKRTEIWKKITADINEEFKNMEGFTVLLKENVQKSTDYWVKNHYGYQKPQTPAEIIPNELTGQDTVSSTPPLLLTPPQTPADHIEHLDQGRVKGEKRDLIAQRLLFLVTLTNELMKTNGLDGKSNERSCETNNRRNKMWDKIQNEVNKRYPTLDQLSCSRVKKSYSNYRRRAREAKKALGGKFATKVEDVEKDLDVDSEDNTNLVVMDMNDVSNEEPIFIDDGTIQTFQDVVDYVKSLEALKSAKGTQSA